GAGAWGAAVAARAVPPAPGGRRPAAMGRGRDGPPRAALALAEHGDRRRPADGAARLLGRVGGAGRPAARAPAAGRPPLVDPRLLAAPEPDADDPRGRA